MLEQVEELYRSIPEDSLRKMAWDRFVTLKLPTKKTETYRYIKLRELNPPPVKKGMTLPNGVPSGVEILPIEEAMKSFGAYLKNRITQTLQNEKDPFAALNGALYKEGFFIYIPPGMKVETPIEIHFDNTTSRVITSLGKGAKATFLLKGDGNTVTDWNIEEGAKLEIIPQMTYGLHAMRATVKKDGMAWATSLTNGSALTRIDFQVDLIGEGARADFAHLSDLSGSNEAHVNVLIRHLAPNAVSNQLIKNIVRDTAHASFEGKIFVDQIAEQTEAYQLNANLLLSDNARAESKPNLEIFNEDVKASHGATFGQIEPEHLFYLQARGLSKKKAMEMLIEGFSYEVKVRWPNFLL